MVINDRSNVREGEILSLTFFSFYKKMKKRTGIAIFLFLCFSNLLMGQGNLYFSIYSDRDVRSKESIEHYNFIVTYNYKFPLDTISDKRYKDVKILKISPSITHYYSKNSDFCDSLAYKDWMNSSEASGVSWSKSRIKPDLAIPEDIYMHYPEKGILTFVTRLVSMEYEYSEPLPMFKWDIILGKSDIILGYTCNVAETIFRGRKYRVYFSPEIPLPYGPWKFSGLPGLILKVEELSGLFEWEAMGISKSKGDIYRYDKNAIPKGVITITDMDSRKISRKQIQALQKKIWDDPISLLQQHGVQFGFSVENRDRFREPYIPPLELE